MHTVHVYPNDQAGTRWWAEDDLGFTGGADRLSELANKIREWAECEGVLDVRRPEQRLTTSPVI